MKENKKGCTQCKHFRYTKKDAQKKQWQCVVDKNYYEILQFAPCENFIPIDGKSTFNFRNENNKVRDRERF